METKKGIITKFKLDMCIVIKNITEQKSKSGILSPQSNLAFLL